MIKDFIDEFLTVFGDVKISDAVVIIMAILCVILVCKRVNKYFEDKATAEVEAKAAQEEKEKEHEEKLRNALDAIAEYPKYRKQSLEIQNKLTKSIDEVSISVKDVSKTVDMNEIKRIRAEIFAFADSCKLGERHTEDSFLHIIDIHEDYKALLEKYEMTNGRISVDYDYIMTIYKELRDKGTFSERTV